MASGANYPPVGFHFRVDFLGLGNSMDAAFQEVTGLGAEMGTEELNVGGINEYNYKLPVRAKYSNLILKRGMAKNSGLVNWFRDCTENFLFKTADLNISLLNDQHQPLATWKITGAYPVKWTFSDFKATESALVIETVEFSYLNYRRE